MTKTKIIAYALIVIFPAFFLSVVYANESGANKVIPFRINSLAVDIASGSPRLALTIEAGNAADFALDAEIKKKAQKSLEYFFIGLTLPDEKFWVNLNPKEPYRLLDSVLADTDLGRIMLYADLRLKKDTCELMNPNESAVGAQYWSRLYEKAKQLGVTDKIPVINQIWIVPGEAEAYEAENKLSIIKSRLKVYAGESKGSDPLQDYALSLMNELILPRLNRKVNESEVYADLREVYQALILARWYKEKFGTQQNLLLRNASYNIMKGAENDFPYQPDQIYRDYLSSFKKGEYSFGGGLESFYPAMAIMRYFIGGINFKRLPVINLVGAPGKANASGTFTVEFNMPVELFKGPNPLQIVKNTMELTPDFTLSSPSPGTIAVAKIFEGLPPGIGKELVCSKTQNTIDNFKAQRAFNNKL